MSFTDLGQAPFHRAGFNSGIIFRTGLGFLYSVNLPARSLFRRT